MLLTRDTSLFSALLSSTLLTLLPSPLTSRHVVPQADNKPRLINVVVEQICCKGGAVCLPADVQDRSVVR